MGACVRNTQAEGEENGKGKGKGERHTILNNNNKKEIKQNVILSVML